MTSANNFKFLAVAGLALAAMALARPAAAGVQAPRLLDGSVAAGAGRPIVLIYYANESHDSPRARRNADWIVDVLLSTADEDLHRAAGDVLTDRVEFPAAVRSDMAGIEAAVAAGRIQAVVFTNAWAASGQYRIGRSADGTWQTADFPVTASDDFVDGSQPLARPGALQAALAEVAAQFPPEQFEYVLVTKSHGTATHALVPAIGVPADEMQPEEFLAPLLAGGAAVGAAAEHALDPPGGSHPLSPPGGADRLDPPGGSNPLGVDSKLFTGGRGVTKAQYAAEVASGIARGMRFRLVFVEACHSGIDDDLLAAWDAGVGWLATSGTEGLDYSTIQYGDLLQRPAGDAAASLVALLREAAE